MIRDFGGQQFLAGMGNVIMSYMRASNGFVKEQAYLMLPDKHYTTVDKAIKGLVYERCIFKKGERDFVANPKSEIDFTMERCLWVMLDMKGDAILKEENDDFWIAPAHKPAKLSYVKNMVRYDIVPFDRGEDHVLKTLEDLHKEEIEKYPESVHKYIIVVPNEKVLDTVPQLNIPHIFAIVNDRPNDQMDYERKEFVDIDYYEG